jgi:hypothetical protein
MPPTSTRHRKHVWFLAVAACGALAAACSAILGGIEPGVLADASTDGVSSADAPGKTDSGSDVQVFYGDAACGMPVDETNGIFVSASGGSSDPTNCGSFSTPCLTISLGLGFVTPERTVIYLAQGNYAESVTLHGGVTLRGGYDKHWEPICGKTANAAVTIAPTSENITLQTASNFDTPAIVANLTILSKTEAATGESLYGVLAVNTSAMLELDDIVIQLAAGGSGAEGASGDAGATGSTGCEGGTGASGGSSGEGGAPGATGEFSATGYTPAQGSAGGPGVQGDDGKITKATCKDCVSCALPCLAPPDAGQSCGLQGLDGCGGQGGVGGAGGGGGGSSIALFAYNAAVKTNLGSISAGNGGAGGKGGPGGPGGRGGEPMNGENGPTCSIACAAVTCGATNGGGVGEVTGQGGSGSSGGPGGGGAGGSSFAVYVVGVAPMIDKMTSLAKGAPGPGASGAPSGQAKTVGP